MTKPQNIFVHWLRYMVILLAVIVTGGLAQIAAPRAQACPMCSELLPNDQGPADAATQTSPDATSPPQTGASLAKGFYYSILFMLAVPFLLVTGLSGMLYLSVKKAREPSQALAANRP